ncbi:MAG: alpha/beta fold hydrolase [Gammaproteobacteria bacterium]
MPSAKINGVDLYYQVQGAGAPLMLIAGLASDSQSWQPVTECLAQHFRLILPDNRGVGRTRPQDAETSIRQIADDCMALIEHLGVPSVNLLGHSMGGFVALECAIRYPDQVDKLILAGTSACNSARNNTLFHDWAAYLDSGMDPEYWFRNIFYWIFSQRFFQHEEALQAAVRFAVEYPYPQSRSAFKKQVQAVTAYNCLENLAAIRAKTMVLCGKEDLLFPPEESMALLRAIPGAVCAVIEHAAHSIHIENPMDFTNQLLNFLSRQA